MRESWYQMRNQKQGDLFYLESSVLLFQVAKSFVISIFWIYREAKYLQDTSKGSYMYWFKHKGTEYWWVTSLSQIIVPKTYLQFSALMPLGRVEDMEDSWTTALKNQTVWPRKSNHSWNVGMKNFFRWWCWATLPDWYWLPSMTSRKRPSFSSTMETEANSPSKTTPGFCCKTFLSLPHL